MTKLRLTCLGKVEMALGDEPLTAFATDKARALLVYLAVEGAAHTRTALKQLFWPGYLDESANNNLRQLLHRLRHLLRDGEAAPWLLITRQTVQLNPAAPIHVDVTTFTRLLAECRAHRHEQITTCQPCLTRLQQAVDLYQGDFLAGFAVVDSDPFEEWRRVTQEQLHIQMLDALRQLADAAESNGDADNALNAARRQLALEPWLEAAHRQVMRLLSQRGQRASAIAQYQRCRQVLAEELGVEPEAETIALYEQIQRGGFDKKTRDTRPGDTRPGDTRPGDTRPGDTRQDDKQQGQGLAWQEDQEGQASRVSGFVSRVSPSPLLPVFLSPLVGRTQTLAEIGAQLQQPGVRLLTLVGPGGMGKTRLAVEVGRACLAAFADGVCFVPLASISAPAALAGALAATLGLPLQEGDPRSLLLQSLRSKQLLLILDNFEHLLVEDTAVDLVVDLLAAAPGVQILVTSRERLKLRGEQVYPVPALAFATTASLTEAEATAAVRLFVQSVQRFQSGFQLTASNLGAVLRICRLVQGIPLGLELAAASAGAPLTAVADAIEQSAEFLAVEWRDLPERQRSMRAIFAWSWQLLSAVEQRILRQSAVFRGGFDYAAAQAVLGATFVPLTRLVDKSLLQWQTAQERGSGAPLGGDGRSEGRYLIHELLRQFAAEELQQAGEAAAVEEQHARYYLAYLADRGLRMGRREPKEACAEVQVELDNVRHAWQWAATQGRFTALEHATYGWWQFCQLQGLEAEGRQSFAAAIAGARAQMASTQLAEDGATVLLEQRLLARLLAIHANFLYVQGRNEEMTAQAREAIDLGRTSNDVAAETFGTFVLGRAAQEVGQLQEADALWRETIDLVQRYQPAQPANEFLHDAHWMALNALRGNAISFGDYAGSRAYLMQALQICQRLGKRQGELLSLSRLAQTDFLLYEFAAAEAGWTAALDLARTLGYRRVEMLAQEGLGGVSRLRGDYTAARRLLEQAVTIATDLAAPYEEAAISATLIRLYTQLGDQAAAAQRHEQLIQILARVQLIKECQLYYQLAAALKAHAAGAKQEALRHAEQAHQLIESGDILFRVADTALILGHTRAAVGQGEAAAAAFHQALTAFQQFADAGNPLGGARALAAEAQAGLAQIALAQGDRAGAQVQVEAILPVLAEQPHAGYNNPFFIYLTAYRVLAANDDPRAAPLLEQGHALLQQDAAQLDGESRPRFLTGVTIHRELVAAYETMWAQKDQETARQDDKKIADRAPEGQNRALLVSPSSLLPVSPSTLHDWAEMPAVDFFVERTAEVAQLTAWLTPATDGSVPARLVSILGMGGMGKTTLAAAVTRAVAPNFAVVIWRSLLNAPPLPELLRNWLQILARQTLTAPPDSLDEQLRLLLTYLQQERCLLVLDNVESIFAADGPLPEGTPQPQGRAGVARPGYEGYDQLFQRLATSDHQSCLLLTSREQPYALLRVPSGRGRQAQAAGRVQVLPLMGLDQAAGHALLASNGLHTSAAEAAQLVENYSGNPLALQIVAATIADFFGGDVAAFQQEEGQFFDGLRLVLDQQFARLSPLERDILVWLAVEREPITVPILRNNFVQPVATAPLLEALQALQDRSLLEKRDSGLTLQNVIIEYTTEYLVTQVCQEIYDLRITSYELRNSAYREEHVIRNSQLVTSFLNRFALLKAQAKEYTRQSQERLILQPVAAYLLKYWGQRVVHVQVQEVLNELRTQDIRHGYAAGNLLNLLIHLGVDLHGYDFSGLAVWQADLRRRIVRNVNLAQADLSHSSFTQTFSRIEGVAISPNGQLLAAAGDGGAIRLFRLPNGEPHALLSGHTNTTTAVAFSPNGAYLASTGDDGLILLWTVQDGRLHRQVDARMPMRTVAFSPDGRLLAGGSRSGALLLWQVERGHLLSTLPLHRQRVNALAFHPAGNLLASAGSDGVIYLYDMSNVLPEDNAPSGAFADGHDNQQVTLPVRTLVADPQMRFFAATFSPDGKRFVAGSGDGNLHLWEAPFDHRTHQVLGHRGEIRAVTFCADSTFLFSGGYDGAIRLWDSQAMRCCQTLTGHAETVYALALGLNDRLLASGSEDATICLWEINPQTQSFLRQRLCGYPQALECVAWSGCGRWLATGDIHGAVRLWDRQHEPPQCTQEITGESTVISLDFTPDGQQLVIGRYADPQGIQIWVVRADGQWSLRSGQRIPLTGVARFSPDASLLALCTSDGNLHLWHTQPLAPCATPLLFTGQRNYVNRLAFTANGQTIATCSNDLTVRLWRLATGEEAQRLPGYGNNTCLAVNAEGTLLACASPDFAIALWDLADPAPKQPLRTLRGHTNEAFACAFSPNGTQLVSAGLDRSVRLWDVQTGAQLALLGYHEQYALDVAFRPDGKEVASIGKEGALHLWQVDTYQPLHQLHAPGPYAGMKITGVTGISDAQKAALRVLGAVEE